MRHPRPPAPPSTAPKKPKLLEGRLAKRADTIADAPNGYTAAGARAFTRADGTVAPRASDVDMVRRRAFVVSLLQAGMSHDAITTACMKELGLSRTTAQTLRRSILDEWKQTLVEDMPKMKAEQAERLRRDIAVMRSQPTPNFAAIARHERLLGEVLGTFEPVRVQVNVEQTVTESLVSIIATMSTDERDRVIEEQRLLEERAREGLH